MANKALDKKARKLIDIVAAPYFTYYLRHWNQTAGYHMPHPTSCWPSTYHTLKHHLLASSHSKPSSFIKPTMASPNKDKARLTEQEKKNNHIASEQKRRQAIRDGFDRLASLTPGYEGQGRSESLVLGAALDHMKEQLALYRKNIRECKAQGI
ncbi:hypothetical protein BT63DRAFT_429003, partial [Microthyrium microscopicum]